jgi:hypothetical protein
VRVPPGIDDHVLAIGKLCDGFELRGEGFEDREPPVGNGRAARSLVEPSFGDPRIDPALDE